MDTVRYFRSRAKELLKSSRNEESRRRIESVLRSDEAFGLQKAQHVIAIESGFCSWKGLIDAPEIERQLAKVMIEEPLLNSFGIGSFERPGTKWAVSMMPEEFEKNRKSLMAEASDVKWCSEWLIGNLAPIKSINLRSTSYGLKHLIGRYSPRKYLTNGAFISGAIIAGYRYRTFPDSPNVSFGISQRSVSALSRRINRERLDAVSSYTLP